MSRNPLMRIKILVQVECDECKGSGAVLTDPENSDQEVDCGVCDGTGHSEIKMPLLHIKNLLNGGTL